MRAARSKRRVAARHRRHFSARRGGRFCCARAPDRGRRTRYAHQKKNPRAHADMARKSLRRMLASKRAQAPSTRRRMVHHRARCARTIGRGGASSTAARAAARGRDKFCQKLCNALIRRGKKFFETSMHAPIFVARRAPQPPSHCAPARFRQPVPTKKTAAGWTMHGAAARRQTAPLEKIRHAKVRASEWKNARRASTRGQKIGTPMTSPRADSCRSKRCLRAIFLKSTRCSCGAPRRARGAKKILKAQVRARAKSVGNFPQQTRRARVRENKMRIDARDADVRKARCRCRAARLRLVGIHRERRRTSHGKRG
jgi:hypothetical protein